LLYEAIDVPTSDSLYLVLEFMSGGTVMDVKLGDTTTPLPTEVAREYFRQLVLGLEYLHENDIAHRDVRSHPLHLSANCVYTCLLILLFRVQIKPDNILLSEDRKIVKFCDFGVSEMFRAGDDRMRKSVGSPAFMSPEAAVCECPPCLGRKRAVS
jgi:[calcium/calmodulin-dependent protein kinase] kinase